MSTSGAGVVGYLLAHLPPVYISCEVVDVIERLLVVALDSRVSSLFDSIVASIVLDFRLWVYTAAEVQMKLILHLLYTIVRKAPRYARQFIGPVVLMQIALVFYGGPTDASASGPDVETLPCRDRVVVHSASGATVGNRLSEEDCTIAREALFAIAKYMVFCDVHGVDSWGRSGRGVVEQ